MTTTDEILALAAHAAPTERSAADLVLFTRAARLRHALGICATQAAGLRVATGTSAGPVQAGKAAFNAVEAAHLARLGFTASRDPLDGRRGLFALFNR